MVGDDQVEVFQDLVLRVALDSRRLARDALIKNATHPWAHGRDWEQKIASGAVAERDVLVFEREAGDGIEAVGLVLSSRDEGYVTTNIVPREVRELGRHRYNLALQDFVAKVAEPAARVAGFAVELGSATQGLDDWLSKDAADALRSFSSAANKATGSAHPMDQRRWFAFLIAVHRGAADFDADRLIRWLCEIEGWSDDKAHDLAIQYEFGLALLNAYDRTEP